MNLTKYEESIVTLIKSFNSLEPDLAISISLIEDGLVNGYRLNDAGHLADHIYWVMNHTYQMGLAFKLSGTQLRNGLLAAFAHDLGCRYNRKYHESISTGLLMELLYKHSVELEQRDLEEILGAVLMHRASFKGEREGKVARIVAAADRGTPDLDVFIKRTLKYNLSKEGMTKEQIIENAYKHLKEKFDPLTGYAWEDYPEEGMEFFGAYMQPLFQELSNKDLVLEKINSGLEKLWELKYS